jgi:hypothetical protein
MIVAAVVSTNVYLIQQFPEGQKSEENDGQPGSFFVNNW